MTKRKPTRPVGETLGGILAGFDQQIMRNQPPPQELVLKGSPVRGLAGEDGGRIDILLPPEHEEPEPLPEGEEPERDVPASSRSEESP